jgi:hypothetical protein
MTMLLPEPGAENDFISVVQPGKHYYTIDPLKVETLKSQENGNTDLYDFNPDFLVINK